MALVCVVSAKQPGSKGEMFSVETLAADCSHRAAQRSSRHVKQWNSTLSVFPIFCPVSSSHPPGSIFVR